MTIPSDIGLWGQKFKWWAAISSIATWRSISRNFFIFVKTISRIFEQSNSLSSYILWEPLKYEMHHGDLRYSHVIWHHSKHISLVRNVAIKVREFIMTISRILRYQITHYTIRRWCISLNTPRGSTLVEFKNIVLFLKKVNTNSRIILQSGMARLKFLVSIIHSPIVFVWLSIYNKPYM